MWHLKLTANCLYPTYGQVWQSLSNCIAIRCGDVYGNAQSSSKWLITDMNICLCFIDIIICDTIKMKSLMSITPSPLYIDLCMHIWIMVERHNIQELQFLIWYFNCPHETLICWLNILLWSIKSDGVFFKLKIFVFTQKNETDIFSFRKYSLYCYYFSGKTRKNLPKKWTVAP